MSNFDWTPFEGGATVKFEDIGDSVIGTVRQIAVKPGKSGDTPVLTLLCDDGEERELWCGAAVLRSEMAAASPQVGDKVKVTLTEKRNVGQPSPMKVFTVQVKRSETPPPPSDDDLSEPF